MLGEAVKIIADFLRTVFQDQPSDKAKISIFCLQSRTVRRFDSYEEAAAFAAERAKTENVYFGLGLIGGEPRGRGKASDVVAIGGIWADVDFTDAH